MDSYPERREEGAGISHLPVAKPCRHTSIVKATRLSTDLACAFPACSAPRPQSPWINGSWTSHHLSRSRSKYSRWVRAGSSGLYRWLTYSWRSRQPAVVSASGRLARSARSDSADVTSAPHSALVDRAVTVERARLACHTARARTGSRQPIERLHTYSARSTFIRRPAKNLYKAGRGRHTSGSRTRRPSAGHRAFATDCNDEPGPWQSAC